MSRILVTGASGFIGYHLCKQLKEAGYIVRAALRQPYQGDLAIDEQAIVGDIDPDTSWQEALADVNTVVHLAARVHVMKEVVAEPLPEFLKVNTAGTTHLAERAAALGVKRFIYISSIKVNGEKTTGQAFTADDPINPQDAYAISKAKTEDKLRSIHSHTNMEVVIVRPPLVYGPGVRGNFLRLLQLIDRGLHLPLAMINNRRSLVSVANLNDLLLCCLQHPSSAGETFLAADGRDWSTPELIHQIAQYIQRRAYLFPVPLKLLNLAGRITGQYGTIHRLCDSLQVDISKNQKLLGWTPPQSSDEGLQTTVKWYLNNKDA